MSRRQRSSQKSGRGATSEGLRITKVGLWWLVLTVVVAMAATNTGNNGLYLVLVSMLATVVVAHFLAALNLRWLKIDARFTGEVFALRPAAMEIVLEEQTGWLPRWLLDIVVEPSIASQDTDDTTRQLPIALVQHLGRHGSVRERQEVFLERRGRCRLGRVRVRSLFPFGLFRKGRVFELDQEVLVWPEIFDRSVARPQIAGGLGQHATAKPGHGQDLVSLRDFLPGDDPRNIHWKQTARSGRMIFKVRDSDESRRLLVLLDNAIGELSRDSRQRFERLVSEAATAALDALAGGYEVGLTTRGEVISFGAGPRHRQRILDTLAVVEPEGRTAGPLVPDDPAIPHLSLAMDSIGATPEMERSA